MIFQAQHEGYAKLLQSCLTLWNPVDCSLPGSSIHGILQYILKNTGVGCHALLQGTLLTQGLSPCLLTSPALGSRFSATRATWEAYRLLQMLYLANLTRKVALPISNLSHSLWSEIQSRTQTPLIDHVICMFAFLIQTALFLGSFFWGHGQSYSLNPVRSGMGWKLWKEKETLKTHCCCCC